MSWNYRIVKYADERKGYGLHEVFYDANGREWSMTENAIDFTCDADEGPNGIRESLHMAWMDSRKRPVFEEPKEGQPWPGKCPHPLTPIA